MLQNLAALVRQPPRGAEPVLPSFGPGFVKQLIEGQDGITDSRALDGYIHVSRLSELCPRRHVLIHKDGLAKEASPHPTARVCWAMGRATETHVRAQLIAAMGRSIVVGKWSCVCGSLVYEGSHRLSLVCPRCRQPATIYGELDVIDGPHGIAGHPDFLFWLMRRLVIMEIKSINKKDFVALTGPEADHAFQIGSYHKMLVARGDMRIAPVGIIVYVSKEYDPRFSPYKEFHIKFSEEEWLQNSLSMAWDKAAAAQAGMNSDQLPPRLPACINPAAPEAKKCCACVSCFSRP